MWHELKEIEKDLSTGLFSLPQKEKPADANSLGELSSGLFPINPERGREAGQGGGA
jgi:hypothetical protein